MEKMVKDVPYEQMIKVFKVISGIYNEIAVNNEIREADVRLFWFIFFSKYLKI